MSHIAIVRSSARAAHAKMHCQVDGSRSELETNQLTSRFPQAIVTSLSSAEESDSIQDIDLSGIAANEYPSTELSFSLPPITCESDIQALVQDDLRRPDIIFQLEENWAAIVRNQEKLTHHLENCNNLVTNASVQCLQTLDSSAAATCDGVNEQIESFRTLISKCVELSVNLRMTEDFREEIKTFRKYVDTLYKLHKSRPIT